MPIAAILAVALSAAATVFSYLGAPPILISALFGVSVGMVLGGAIVKGYG